MINTVAFGVGFVVYVLFCLLTIDVYSKKKEINTMLVFPTIYVYYTILAAYVINFANVDALFWEKAIQVIIYALACAIVCFYYYENVIKQRAKIRI